MASRIALTEEALSYGWTTFKANTGVLLGFAAIVGVASILPGFISSQLIEQGSIASKIFTLISIIYNAILGLVIMRVGLDFFDKGKPDFGSLSSYMPRLFKYLLGNLLYGALTVIGFFLLIVPGFIVTYMFFFTPYLVADKDLGPIEALKESKRLTNGIKWDLFILSLALGILNLVGVLLLVVGLLVTIPVTLLALVYAYRKGPGRAVAAAA